MPGFVGHTVANTAILVGTSAVMRTQGWSWQDVVAVDVGIAIASLVLSPDMDLFNSKSIGVGLATRFWLPYSKLAKHRDRLHVPILGTAVRWLYVGAILLLLTVLFRFWFRRTRLSVDFDFAGDTDDIIYNALYLVDVFIGAVLADTTHYVLDVISTRLKQLVPRRFRERYDRYAQNHHDRDHRLPQGRQWIAEENQR